MAALPDSQPRIDAEHVFHADAYILSADLEQPVRTEFKKQVLVELPQNGRIQYERAIPYQLKGILAYQGGYTQVAGHPSSKVAGGFTTVATTVVEGLNVLDVLTADRVVGQISTVHPPYSPEHGLTDPVPSVTFLGTRFENLTINGHKVDPKRHLDILGPKPAGAGSYHEDRGVLGEIKAQYKKITSVLGLPEWARERFAGDGAPTQDPDDDNSLALKCSLVSSVSDAPDISFGHVIDLPHFGKIFLGELKVNRKAGEPATANAGPSPDTYTFHLAMVRLELGCLAVGTATVAALDTNGTGGKGGH